MKVKQISALLILLIFNTLLYAQEIQNVHLHFDNSRNMEIVFDANAENGKKVKITNVDISNGENVFLNPSIEGDILQVFSSEKKRKIVWYLFQDMNKIILSGRISVQLYYTVYNEQMQEVLKNTTIFTQNVIDIKCPSKEMMNASVEDKKMWRSFAQTVSESPLTEIQTQTLKKNRIAENPFHKKVDISIMRGTSIEADATYLLMFIATSHFEVEKEEVSVFINGKTYQKLTLERTKLDSLSMQFEQKLNLMPYLEKGNPDVTMEIQIKKQGVISAFRQILRMGNIRPYNEVYALAVGINNYMEGTTSYGKLNYPKTGAKNFANCLENKLNVKKENICSLSEDFATKYIILDSLKKQVKRCTERDLLLFYFAGHGNEKGLIPYNYEFIYPNSVLSYAEMKEILKSCKAKNIILFCDAEFSDHLLDENDGDFSVGLLASSNKNEISFLVSNNESIFNYYIIKGLEGDADASGNGLINMKELSEYVIRHTNKETLEQQSPIGKATNENMIIGNLGY